MHNIALEFSRALKGEVENPSAPCSNLLFLYKNPKVSLDLSLLQFTKNKCFAYYKNKYEEFLDLLSYLSEVNISDKEYFMVSKFLEECSEVEAEVYLKLFTVPMKVVHGFKRYQGCLGMCVVQQIPKYSSRLVLKISLGEIKSLYGLCPKELESSLKGSFKNFQGTLDGYVKGNTFYLHDILEEQPTKNRIVFISNFSQSKFLKVLRGTFHINEEDVFNFFKNSDILLKPINGNYKEVYLRKGSKDETNRI